jgi:hypothetical protein
MSGEICHCIASNPSEIKPETAISSSLIYCPTSFTQRPCWLHLPSKNAPYKKAITIEKTITPKTRYIQ